MRHLHGERRARQNLQGPEVGARPRMTRITVVIGVGLGLTRIEGPGFMYLMADIKTWIMGIPGEVWAELVLHRAIVRLIPIQPEPAPMGAGVPWSLVWLEPCNADHPDGVGSHGDRCTMDTGLAGAGCSGN